MLGNALLNKRIIAYKYEELGWSFAVEDADGEISIVNFVVETEDTWGVELHYEIVYPISISGGWIIYKPENDGTENTTSGNKG